LKNITRTFTTLLVIAAIGIVAYTIGKWVGAKNSDTRLIQNYSFVKNIVELAALEVSGTTTFKTTNADSSSGFWSSMKKYFTETSATITIPYTAKYGSAFKEKEIQIEKKDSIVLVIVPLTRLLSFELHMDRLETTSKKGLLIFQLDEFYNQFYKRMYADARRQLETNAAYLKQSEKRIEEILQQYYAPLGLKVKCVFEK
jgi:hypothetical protein